MSEMVSQRPVPQAETPCCPDLLLQVPSEADARRAAAMFRAMGDPARLKLLSLIASAPTREVCVCDLWSAVGLSQSTVSHHLKVLLAAGLVARRQKGTWAYYRIRPEALSAMAQALTVQGLAT